MTPNTELDRMFSAALHLCAKPDAIIPSPDFGHEAQDRDHGGVIDLNEVTAGDRATVAHINTWRRNRDRNATPRSGGDEPKDAA